MKLEKRYSLAHEESGQTRSSVDEFWRRDDKLMPRASDPET